MGKVSGELRQERLDMKGRSETVVAQGRRKGKAEKRRWEGVGGKGKGRGRKWYVGKRAEGKDILAEK
jgi:hypothetical protein